MSSTAYPTSFGTSYSTSYATSSNKKSGRISNIRIKFMGDSILKYLTSQYSGAGDAAFDTEAANYFNSAILTDGARSGSFLTETTALADDLGNTNLFWVGDSGTLAKGPQYTANVTNDVNRNITDLIFLNIGTNDHSYILSDSSKSDWKTAYQQFIDWLFEDHAALREVVIVPPASHLAGDDAGWRTYIEVVQEIVAENSRVNLMNAWTNQDRADNVHPTQAAIEFIGESMARYAGKKYGRAATAGIIGPRFSNMELKTDILEFGVNLDGASDHTAPTDLDNLALIDDGTIIVPASYTKGSATTGSLTLPEGVGPVAGSSLTFWTHYDADGLAQTSPGVLVNNASDPLPLQLQKITPTNADPIQSLSNLAIYWDARASAKTYTTGSDVATIAKLAGSVSQAEVVTASSTEPTFTTNYLSFGSGDQIDYGPFTISANHVIGIAFRIPTAIAAGNMIAFSNSAGATDNQARAVMAGDDQLYWALGEDNNSQQITGLFSADTDYMLFFEFIDGDTLNVYRNQFTTPDYTIDPRNDYYNDGVFTGWDYLSLGARKAQTDAILGRYYAYFHVADAGLTSTEKSNIATYWADRFSIS